MVIEPLKFNDKYSHEYCSHDRHFSNQQHDKYSNSTNPIFHKNPLNDSFVLFICHVFSHACQISNVTFRIHSISLFLHSSFYPRSPRLQLRWTMNSTFQSAISSLSSSCSSTYHIRAHTAYTPNFTFHIFSPSSIQCIIFKSDQARATYGRFVATLYSLYPTFRRQVNASLVILHSTILCPNFEGICKCLIFN